MNTSTKVLIFTLPKRARSCKWKCRGSGLIPDNVYNYARLSRREYRVAIIDCRNAEHGRRTLQKTALSQYSCEQAGYPDLFIIGAESRAAVERAENILAPCIQDGNRPVPAKAFRTVRN